MQNHRFRFNWFDIPGKSRAMTQAMLFQLSQTEKFSRGQLAELQLGNLKKLLQHCTEHVPYYRRADYFLIDNWSDWNRIPLLSRREVQERPGELHADMDMKFREGRAYKMRSSGSTGRPVEVLTTERAQIYWYAQTVRDHLWQRRDFSQKLAVIKHFNKGKAEPPGVRAKQWGPSTGLLYATGPSVSLNSSTDISTQYQWLREMQPGYLLVYPSLLRALAQKNRASDDPIQLRGISTIGENLTPETRHFAQDTFGGRVCDIYSCQESGYIALQCPVHDHYHIQAETALVEILNEDNQACAPGETGRVVVTHLHNYAMPLLRYEIGDYAVAGGTCDCGINLPVIERVIGRTRNLVSYPNGEKNWPSYNPMKLMEILPEAQFQLVQKNLDTLLLRIGTLATVPDDVLQEISGVINEAMRYPFNIQVEQLEQIARSKSGKYEEFVSEIPDV